MHLSCSPVPTWAWHGRGSTHDSGMSSVETGPPRPLDRVWSPLGKEAFLVLWSTTELSGCPLTACPARVSCFSPEFPCAPHPQAHPAVMILLTLGSWCQPSPAWSRGPSGWMGGWAGLPSTLLLFPKYSLSICFPGISQTGATGGSDISETKQWRDRAKLCGFGQLTSPFCASVSTSLKWE